MNTPRTDAARALALALLLIGGCDDGPECATCVDDTEAPGAASLELSQDAIDFGELTLGETAREALPVGNPGSAELVLSEITVTEPFVARYDDGMTVGPNASAMLYVEITPAESDSWAGTLSFEWNDPDAEDDSTLVEIPVTASVPADTGID